MKSLVIYRPCYAVTRPAWLLYPICHEETTPLGIAIELRNKDVQVVVDTSTTLEAMEIGMSLINNFLENKDKCNWRKDLGQL